MGSLIARLEAGPGSRELSDECLLAVGWGKLPLTEYLWIDPSGKTHDARPDPSQNVQDAIDWMVPEGWSGGGRIIGGPPYPIELLRVVGEGRLEWGHAATPALALSAASLRARVARPGDKC